ncbi:MAG: choice-of-anchor R domain-containing protein [Patescibacteria group bacterium]
MQTNHKKQNNKGAAMLIVVMFSLFASMTVVMGVVVPVLKQAAASKNIFQSKESFYMANSALEDAVYRIQNGMDIDSGDILTLNGHDTVISVTDTINGKIIETISDRDGIVRKMQSEVTLGEGVAFNYGIQVGEGGFELSGGSRVNGNVYSNGNIHAVSGVTITGSAIAGNGAVSVVDVTNDTPLPPTNNVTFRNAAASQDFAQSFQVTQALPIKKISFYVRRVGSPSDATVRIVNDSGGSPGTTNLLSSNGTLSSSLVTTNYGWVDVVLPSNPTLTPGTTYWLVIDNSTQHSSRYYEIGGNTSYASGVAKVGAYSGVWNNTSPSGLDGYFKIYLGGEPSYIGGDSYVGGVNIGGTAHANTVRGASVTGALYCQTGVTNNKACDTSLPDPSPLNYPVSEANINDWKAGAESGGVTTGNVTIGWAGGSLGPRKIVGNLTVNGGGVLTLNGNLWVTGTVTVSGGGQIRLSSSYGSSSGVMVADGAVVLSGGGALAGSGQAGSYLMLLSTYDSSCVGSVCSGDPAIIITGGAGSVILNAPNGILEINGAGSVKSATAYKIEASGGATITYESGLADMNFNSGPSGGFSISSWEEIE